ncbi:repressor LexA [Candidatus Roizmanbacteria bacterium RIFCSPLOWO2_01_FULL_37_12]|uniref:Repressor LexA n=1 Tax=Candidatus Roizmanbacteria bacterium RIFCSPLOWO2_01_FULL_37_12 TaxID=1802056 RepID=A0A1F7IE70_9BACT|nr:MAG: repressor LexA [Candidatus Roizmanbacteria bacterium RIFCSPLOWO2_01_FULL_37_12]
MNDRLDKIKKFYKKHRRLPSYSEMLNIFNLASKNAVFKIIQKLIEAGFIKKEGAKIAPASKFFALPLVGLVKAGFPILAEENRDYLTLDDYLIGDPQSAFLLKVSGDSLIGLGIFDGDIVIIERKRPATSGDIVLAQIDREWTLKILKKDGIRAHLESANPKYPPFYPKQNLEIFGVVKAVVRKFN